MKSRLQILLDLASTLQRPLIWFWFCCWFCCWFWSWKHWLVSEVDPEVSTALNSASPSQGEVDDDSVADKHYNPAKDTALLEEDDCDDMDVDSDDPEEISPIVKKVKSHVRGCLRNMLDLT